MKHKRRVSMIIMHTIVTVIIIVVSLFIVGTIYHFLNTWGWVNLEDTNNPVAAMLPVLALSALAGTFISFLLGRTIMRPMRAFQEAFKVVSKGDFSHHIDVKTHVIEVEEMMHAFNHMVDGLASIETLSNDFIANVSHEFKTPLAAIEAYAVLLQSKDLDEQQKEEYISKIRVSAEDLSLLTGNILNLSRVENVDFDYNTSEFRLDEQIRNTILMNEKDWSKKNIEFDLDLDLIKIDANQNLLAQVWQNLIENAIKFSHEDSIIVIRLKEEDEKILFSIRDFGIGISKEEQEYVFDKFFQGDTSRKGYGNGLGLSLVKRIVELNKGSIKIYSDLGEGSEISIVLRR